MLGNDKCQLCIRTPFACSLRSWQDCLFVHGKIERRGHEWNREETDNMPIVALHVHRGSSFTAIPEQKEEMPIA